MPSNVPHATLQLGLNVLIEQSCGGCNWHSFPYSFQSILSGKSNEIVEINNVDDIWIYIRKLQIESWKIQKKGKDFSILLSIWDQLPFFACHNKILSDDVQKDISKYIYSMDTHVPVYPGSYGDQPALWIEKYNTMKKAFNIRKELYNRKMKLKQQQKSN
tara:strand:+ start:1022 stop:1501 length:480 start_codon:yes stop_codon:yes gene_type:complete